MVTEKLMVQYFAEALNEYTYPLYGYCQQADDHRIFFERVHDTRGLYLLDDINEIKLRLFR